MAKTHIYTFVLGSILTVFVFHAYFFYQIRKATIENTAIINQIVEYLQKTPQGIGSAKAPTE